MSEFYPAAEVDHHVNALAVQVQGALGLAKQAEARAQKAEAELRAVKNAAVAAERRVELVKVASPGADQFRKAHAAASLLAERRVIETAYIEKLAAVLAEPFGALEELGRIVQAAIPPVSASRGGPSEPISSGFAKAASVKELLDSWVEEPA